MQQVNLDIKDWLLKILIMIFKNSQGERAKKRERKKKQTKKLYWRVKENIAADLHALSFLTQY